MFHFQYQAGNLTKNKCAVHQILCTCDACLEQLDLPWDKNKTTAEQPCFAAPDANCYFEPMMQGLNKWHIISLVQVKGEQEQVDGINEVLQSAISYKASLQEPLIDVGKFGIVDCVCDEAKDSALLVEWTALPTLSKKKLRSINGRRSNPSRNHGGGGHCQPVLEWQSILVPTGKERWKTQAQT